MSFVTLRAAGGAIEASFGFAGGLPSAYRCRPEQFRRVDGGTLLARLDVPNLSPSLYDGLRGFLRWGTSGLDCRVVLTRSEP